MPDAPPVTTATLSVSSMGAIIAGGGAARFADNVAARA